MKMNKLLIPTLALLLLSASSSSAVTIGSLNWKGTQSGCQQLKEDPPQSNKWIQVPPWLAGTWETKFQTFLDSYDCGSGKQLLEQPKTVPVFKHRRTGEQQDSAGQIWHYASTPYVRSSETESFIETQTVEQLDVLSLSASQLKIRTVGKVARWSKNSQGDSANFYEVTTVTYSPLGQGLVKSDLTITDYDADGRPLLHSISVCVERRVKPFAVVNSDARGDLHERFLRFLADREGQPAPR